MLPGLRFLCAAAVLSMSLLVFGFGATALFRSARQDVASLPVLRAPPETVFAQPESQPRLAMLRVEPPAADSDASSAAAGLAAVPVDPAPPATSTLTETDRTAAPEKLAALSPPPEPPVVAEAPQPPQPLSQIMPEAAKPDVPAPIEITKLETAPAAAPDVVAPAPPAIAERLTPVTTEPTPVAADPAPAIQPPPVGPTPASTTIATLGGPAVTITPVVAAKPMVAAPKKAVHKQTVKRKRVAARAAPTEASQAAPFAPPFR